MSRGEPARIGASTNAPRALQSAGMQISLRVLSVVTMLLALPQVLIHWIGREAVPASWMGWGAYLLGAGLWYVYGIHKSDKEPSLACIAWIAFNAAIVIGGAVAT